MKNESRTKIMYKKIVIKVEASQTAKPGLTSRKVMCMCMLCVVGLRRNRSLGAAAAWSKQLILTSTVNN